MAVDPSQPDAVLAVADDAKPSPNAYQDLGEGEIPETVLHLDEPQEPKLEVDTISPDEWKDFDPGGVVDDAPMAGEMVSTPDGKGFMLSHRFSMLPDDTDFMPVSDEAMKAEAILNEPVKPDPTIEGVMEKLDAPAVEDKDEYIPGRKCLHCNQRQMYRRHDYAICRGPKGCGRRAPLVAGT